MRRFSLLFIAGIIAIAVFLGLNSYESYVTGGDSQVATLLLDYDAYAEGINTVLYNAAGVINYTLQANRQVHFNDDRTELDKPFIRLFDEGNSRWNIAADSGRISPLYDANDERAQTIELSGNIEVISLDGFGNRLHMSTEQLTVNPQTKTLETDHAVTIVTDALHVTSTGLYADLTQDEVILKRETRGYYEQTAN